MGAQLRYVAEVRRQSFTVLHGLRHTPSRHCEPASHCASVMQKGRRRVSGTHTPWSEQ
jgi:hypothetical protein